MRGYECMLILPAEADEATVGTATDRIAKVAAAHGGEISKIDRWGRRRFAYEIDHQHEGLYVVVNFSAEPAAQLELERTLNLADEVLRFKVVVLPPVREKQLAASPASAPGGGATSQGE